MGTKEEGGNCAVCTARLTELWGQAQIQGMPQIFGPGGSDRLKPVRQGWACPECGLLYRHPPKPKEQPHVS